MNCRPHCGACCIAPSISSPIPGMPNGKNAGERCVQLTQQNFCKLFGKPERPAVCSTLMPQPDICGQTFAEAMDLLNTLELSTRSCR